MDPVAGDIAATNNVSTSSSSPADATIAKSNTTTTTTANASWVFPLGSVMGEGQGQYKVNCMYDILYTV